MAIGSHWVDASCTRIAAASVIWITANAEGLKLRPGVARCAADAAVLRVRGVLCAAIPRTSNVNVVATGDATAPGLGSFAVSQGKHPIPAAVTTYYASRVTVSA